MSEEIKDLEKDVKEVKDEKSQEKKEEIKEDKKEAKAEATDNKKAKNGNGTSSNKLLMGVIIALALVIVGLVVFLVVGLNKKDKKEGTDETTTNTEQVNSEENNNETDSTTEAADNNTTESSSNEKPSGVDIKVECTNTWEEGGNVCGGMTISIVNNTSAELKNWTLEIDVPEGFSCEGWCATYELSGNVLKITPENYNSVIPANGKVQDLGMNAKAKSKEDLDKLGESVRLYVDGTLFDAASAPSDKTTEASDSTEEKTSENTSEETTVEAQNPPAAESGTPFENHGKLSVEGTDIVDKNGNKFQLKGLSTHGMAWFPQYVNKDAFQTFRDDWNANLIRLAMYTDENGGYCNGGNKEELKSLVDKGVNAATELGMYVIIDWHILYDLTPQKYKSEALLFFDEMSKKYKDYDNVIYEICNEPNGGTSWDEVKSYAEEVIPVIRKNAPDAIIIVGTPTWSQDVDIAAANPVTGYDNIMYAIHFYAATHTDFLRNKAVAAIEKGLPIFVSEFSICDASGNGAIDYNQAEEWFKLINQYNLSYAAWNISNKDETSSILRPSVTSTSGWKEDDYSDAGSFIRDKMLTK